MISRPRGRSPLVSSITFLPTVRAAARPRSGPPDDKVALRVETCSSRILGAIRGSDRRAREAGRGSRRSRQSEDSSRSHSFGGLRELDCWVRLTHPGTKTMGARRRRHLRLQFLENENENENEAKTGSRGLEVMS